MQPGGFGEFPEAVLVDQLIGRRTGKGEVGAHPDQVEQPHAMPAVGAEVGTHRRGQFRFDSGQYSRKQGLEHCSHPSSSRHLVPVPERAGHVPEATEDWGVSS